MREAFIGQNKFQIQQITKQIERDGCYWMANYELAEVYLKELLLYFPKLKLVTGLGSHGVSDCFYLPHKKQMLLNEISRNKKQAEELIQRMNDAEKFIISA